MKREFLTGLGLEKEAIDQIMAQNGIDIENAKKDVATLEAERDQYRTQAEAANAEIERFKGLDIEGIQKAADDWKSKYDAETTALSEQLKQKDYTHAIERLVDNVQFSSNAAKRAFLGDLTAKKLPLEGGKLMGYDDFLAQYKESDPGTFKAEEGQQPPPQFQFDGSPKGNPKDTQDEFQKRINKYAK